MPPPAVHGTPASGAVRRELRVVEGPGGPLAPERVRTTPRDRTAGRRRAGVPGSG